MNKIEIYKAEDQESHTVELVLSDGKTRIQTVVFEDGISGICIVRDNPHVKPFSTFNPGELPDNAIDLDEDKILLLADNERSIDVLIERLQEAKKFIIDFKNGEEE